MNSMVPKGWGKSKIGDCCEVLDSQRIPLNSVERASRKGDYPYYGANGIQGYIDDFIFDGEAVLVAEDGGNFDQYSERAIAQWVSGKYWVNNHAHILRARENDIDKWVFYSLVHKNILKFINGGTRAKLNQSDLREIEILSPPLSEQKKIASILTSVDEVIENTQKQIDKLQDLKKATMNELLTKGIGHKEFKGSELGQIPVSWEVHNVSKLLVQSKEKAKKNLPIYSVLIVGGMTPRASVDRRVESNLTDEENLFAPKDSLVYNMMRMWQGASGIAPVDCLVSPAYVVCRPTNLILPSFLGYLMKVEQSIQELNRYSQGITADRMRLYFQHFQEIKLAVPPLNEQAKISKHLAQMECVLRNKSKELAATQSLKRSLMQDLLTGKVRVTVN